MPRHVLPILLCLLTAAASAARAADAPKANVGRGFWSFVPLSRVEPPAPKDPSKWARTGVDRFILAAQEAKELAPSPEADRATLVRRLYFDLLGLPPTPGNSTPR